MDHIVEADIIARNVERVRAIRHLASQLEGCSWLPGDEIDSLLEPWQPLLDRLNRGWEAELKKSLEDPSNQADYDPLFPTKE